MKLSENQKKLLAYINELARCGKTMPTNKALGEILGINYISASRLVSQLIDLGLITSAKAGSRRVVTVIKTGLSTARPQCKQDVVIVRPKITEIIQATADVFDLMPKDITQDCRSFRYTNPRWAVCYIAHKRGYSQAVIGRVLNRDHKTISYGARRAVKLYRGDRGYAAKLRAIEHSLPRNRKFYCAPPSQSSKASQAATAPRATQAKPPVCATASRYSI